MPHAALTTKIPCFGSTQSHSLKACAPSRRLLSSQKLVNRQSAQFRCMASATSKPQVGQTVESDAGGLTDQTQTYTLKEIAGDKRYEIAPGQKLEFATSAAQAFIRFGSAAFVSSKLANFRKRPAKPIVLYEFEGCPFCRKVRETCTILDIDVLFYPCPRNGPTWRKEAISKSGKSQFPYMEDPNTGKALLESDAIIKYLVNEYGDGSVPLPLNLGPITSLTAGLAMLPRINKGLSYRPSKLPKQPIAIWGYEASPFCKQAREVLVELEIPHKYITVARNSPKRQGLINKWGVFQVPYIEDPNTSTCMFETKPIIDYLNNTYAA